MQKKLLSLAIAGALAVPGAAMADVTSNGSNITVYGKFHASWDYVDTDISTNDADDSDDNTAVFRNSRLGFKGSENLGSNGLKGIWQVETELDTVDNQVQLRNTFVGLQGDQWGRIIFGKHDTPYKTATAKLDIFSDTIADYNNIIGAHIIDTAADDGTADATAMNFNEREPQLVMYTTPNFNGFSGQIARESYQEDEDDGGNKSDEELEAWSVMAMYDQGPFFASLAYEVFSGDLGGSSTSTNDDEEIDAWKLGLGYTFGNSTIGFVYEDIEHDNDAYEFASRDAYWASFSHKFGANNRNVFKLAYGKADDSDVDDADDGADNWSVGIDHHFSKRTKVYAVYTDMDNDDEGYYNLYSTQLNTSDYSVGRGQDSDAFSIGIVHKP